MSNISTFELNEPLDMHLHLRDGEMLGLVGPLTSETFSGALVMPNLVPPITTKKELLSYKERINAICEEDNFEPYLTLFFKNDYSYEFLEVFPRISRNSLEIISMEEVSRS